MGNLKTVLGLLFLLAMLPYCTEGEPAAPENIPVVDDSDNDEEDDESPDIDADPSNELFENKNIPSIQLTLNAENFLEMHENALAEEYVQGSADLLGQTLESIGIRYKGAVGSLRNCFDGNGQRNNNCAKLSLKLRFNKFVDGQKFLGLKRLNLHSMNGDPSKIRETLAYAAYRDNGVPAPRTSYVHVFLNDEDLGLYVAIENIDGRFTRSRFPESGDGNLYKEAWPRSEWENYFLERLKTNEDDNPSATAIVDFSVFLASSTENEFKENLADYMDIDHWLKYLAISRLLGHWDGVFAWYCGIGGGCGNHNFYWVEDPVTNRFTIIPWDYDNSMFFNHFQWEAGIPSWAENNPDCVTRYPLFGSEGNNPTCDPLLGKTRAHFWEAYKETAGDLIQNYFTPIKILDRIDETILQIENAVSADPLVDTNQWIQQRELLKTLAQEKRTIAEAELLND